MKMIMQTLSFLFLLTEICFSQWVIHEPITELNQNDVCYSGSDKVFIICDKGVLLLSDNSGSTWNQLQLTDYSDLNALFFVDEDYGFIAGDSGKIFRTENCWVNWIDVSIDFYFHINDISFYDYYNGIAVGTKEVRIDGRTYFLPSIHITSDAGISWVEKQFDFRGRLNSVSYLDDGIVLAVGDSGLVLKSTDYGSNWSMESLNVSSNLNLVRICPEYITIITGDEGTFLYSSDLGENWQSIEVEDYYHITGACYNTSGEIIASCTKQVRIDFRTYFMATVIRLDLQSNTWTEEFSQVRGKFNCVSFCVPNSAITVGDSGLVAVYNSPSNAGDAISLFSFSLCQNYPNPFNPSTKIKYSVPKMSNVVIKVFDVLGNEIETLVNEEKPVGTYELTWNAEQQPSGIYFYRIQAGSFIDTKKMILLK